MITSTNAFRLALLILISMTSLIFMIKPLCFFKEDGSVKPFGLHNDDEETMIPLFLFAYLSMILVYLLVLYLETKISK